MSLDELRERNRQKVIETALDCFVEHGIFNTKIASVAKAAGLTERSVYRYFESKSELVLSAALLFWDNNVKMAEEVFSGGAATNLNGARQIREVLLAYARLYSSDRKKLIFIHEAEIYLYREQKGGHYLSRPPAPYGSSTAPLAKAIKHGVADGSVRTDINLESLYYSTYDSLLGLMQKMALSNEYMYLNEDLAKRRLRAFCEMLTAAFMA